MLYKLDVITPQGDVLELPFEDDSEGYTVKPIEGLDPVKATLVSSSFANSDGEQYHSSRREARDIELKLGLEPNQFTGTGRQLRNNLYKYLMPKANVKLRFYDTELDVEFVDIEGVVEVFDCPLFVPEIEATINIRCYEPDFVSPEVTTVIGYLTDTTDETLIEYNGTVETGFKFRVLVGGIEELPNFTIYHRGPDNVTTTLEFEETLINSDILEISTVTGSKGAMLYNDLTGDRSILYGITPESNWINLFPGKNYIRVFSEDVAPGLPYYIEYTTKYGGL